MRKTLLSGLLIAIMLLMGTMSGFALSKDANGVYQITNSQDLTDFANLVNYGDDPAASAVMTADIDLSGVVYTPIGSTTFPYAGTFDGQGHVLNNLYIDGDAIGVTEYLGTFGVLAGGAYIKNLVVAGGENVFIGGTRFVGGIAGGTIGKGTVTIENCGNEAWIYCTGENAAGIIGVDMLSGTDLVLLNCYNTGLIQGGRESAALCGWAGDRAVVRNCWNTGEIASGVDAVKPFCRFNGAEFENCWDVQGIQANIGTISPTDLAGLATGEFCYKVLDKTLTTNISWYQTIGTDAHPYPFMSHGTVYAVGDLNCDGSSKSGVTNYSNTNSSTRDPHTFVDGACTVCDEFDPSYMTPDAQGFYTLAKSADLYWFARLVNIKGQNKANARLSADIVYDKQKRIGVDQVYTGTFDGQGHTVTVAFTSTFESLALFGFVDATTIQNLRVSGTLDSSSKFVAGIVSIARNNSVIKNCVADVAMSSTFEGDGTHGGICAVGNDNLLIENCAFTGTMNAPMSEGTGGIMGWTHGGSNTQIKNCYVSGLLTLKTGSNNIVICRNNPYVENCWVSSDNNIYNTNAYTTFFDPSVLASGELCYNDLNAKVTTNPMWYQTLGSDMYPVPFTTHGIVYVAGAQNCDGTPKGGAEGYSNDPSGNRDPHTFADGFCTVCGATDTNYLQPGADGVYTLSTENELYWFMKYAKTLETKNASAKLGADINFTKQEMFGADRLNYSGTFDGQGHTVTLNYKKESGDRSSLFDLVENATIKNLIIDGTIESVGKHVAGLVVESYGTTTIKNILVKANMTSYFEGDGTHGGICAIGHGFLTIDNCAFVGTLDASLSSGSGGILGYPHDASKTTIKNCYVGGSLILLDGADNNTICRNNPFVDNCWASWDVSSYNNNVGVGFFEPAGEMATGQLCFALNGKTSKNVNWYQTVGTDAYPVPFPTSSIVYAHGTVACDGTENNVTYDNTVGALTYEPHTFVDGVCTACNNAYQIRDVNELMNFTAKVMDGSATSAYAELAADMDLSGEVYIPIGGRTDEGSNPYTGTFDGKGHKVSNMIINTTANNQGFFGVVANGAHIKNLVVDATCSITVTGAGKGYAAGIVGATAGNGKVTIENCGNEAPITVEGPNASGILGVDDLGGMVVTINNCYNTGNISGGRESAAICGWLGAHSVMTNCWNSGAITGLDGANTFYRNTDAKTVNCYETVGKQATQVSADILATGELTWKLNAGNTQDVVWYQTLGTDAHPVFDASHGVVYENQGVYTNDLSGIETVNTVAKSTTEAIYSIDGAKLQNMQKGINIVRKADGSVRKVLVK